MREVKSRGVDRRRASLSPRRLRVSVLCKCSDVISLARLAILSLVFHSIGLALGQTDFNFFNCSIASLVYGFERPSLSSAPSVFGFPSLKATRLAFAAQASALGAALLPW